MMEDINLLPIPQDKYRDYRYRVIFDCFKWDPQVGDTNTIANEVAVLSPTAAHQLGQWAEALAQETTMMEEALLKYPSLWDRMSLPRAIQRSLRLVRNYRSQDHVRLMRFDFHPTTDGGWAVSEVNSDVPGGLAEASLLPRLASTVIPNVKPYGDLGASLGQAFAKCLGPDSRLAFIHATSYSDDRQVMESLSHHCTTMGFRSVMAAPDHIRWTSDGAQCIAQGQEGKVDGLIRFFPVEWLGDLPHSCKWSNYFSTTVLSCNHPVAILTQSKRLPLVWDKLDVSTETWRKLLPETADPRSVNWRQDGWILKPAFGRVGEDITIKEAITPKEWRGISWNARLFPREWVAQRRFDSRPLPSTNGQRHLCIGVFTVQGKVAGFYGRTSAYPRIDMRAQDIPVLVSDKEEMPGERT